MLTISLIMATLNEEEHIEEALDRAWASAPDEVIVVDGGSTDRTVALAEAKNCRLIQTGRGRAHQQNLGAQQAKGEVLFFLHADCSLPAGGVNAIREALANSQVDGGAFAQQIDAPGRKYRIVEWGNRWRATWWKLPYGDQGLFFRREIFEQLGQFPEVPLMEDLLLMRAFRRQHRGVVLPGPLIVSARRWQQRGVLRQTLKNWGLLFAQRIGIPLSRLAPYYPPHQQQHNEPKTDEPEQP